MARRREVEGCSHSHRSAALAEFMAPPIRRWRRNIKLLGRFALRLTSVGVISFVRKRMIVCIIEGKLPLSREAWMGQGRPLLFCHEPTALPFVDDIDFQVGSSG